MKFSVLIPVYNVERYIGECIESVLEQSIDDYEIILVDDGSTDRSLEICERYKSKKVNIFHKENEGLLLARRDGIAKAKGEYCVFLDSDDTIEPNCLETIKDLIEKYSADALVYNLMIWDSSNGKKELREPVFRTTRVFITGENIDEIKRKFLSSSSLNNMVIKAVKTDIIKSDTTNYRSELFSDYGEDAIQSYYIFDKCKRIVYTPKGLYNYRKNFDSITRKYLSYENVKSKVKLGSEQIKMEYLKKWGMDDEDLEEIICVNRLDSLRVIFSTNYLQIGNYSDRRKYLHNDWVNLIGKSNYEYLHSKKLPFFHRLEIEAIIKKRFFTLELIRKIRIKKLSTQKGDLG